MAGVDFVTKTLGNEFKEPAFMAGSAVLDIEAVWARGRVEEHVDGPPWHFSAVAAAREKRQFLPQQIQNFEPGIWHKHLRKETRVHCSDLAWNCGFFATRMP